MLWSFDTVVQSCDAGVAAATSQPGEAWSTSRRRRREKRREETRSWRICRELLSYRNCEFHSNLKLII